MPDYLARVAARAAGLRQQVESDRERNRRDMPEATRIMDMLDAGFGKPQWCRWTEGGRTVEWGKPIAYTVAVPASASPLPKLRRRAADTRG